MKTKSRLQSESNVRKENRWPRKGPGGSNPSLSAKKNILMERVCENCGKKLEKSSQKRFCSGVCSQEYNHKIAYRRFLENPEKFCNGGYTPKNFKQEFLKEQNGVCAICGGGQIHNGKPLVFVLDHIDGDASNNKRENLRMICPNCDSQLDTFKSKNKNSKRRNYWKEKIIRGCFGFDSNADGP